MKTCIGKYGLETRNKTGDMLTNFTTNQGMGKMNNFYKKKLSRKWTWISHNGKTRNESDFLLTSKEHVFQGEDVLIQFSTGINIT